MHGVFSHLSREGGEDALGHEVEQLGGEGLVPGLVPSGDGGRDPEALDGDAPAVVALCVGIDGM